MISDNFFYFQRLNGLGERILRFYSHHLNVEISGNIFEFPDDFEINEFFCELSSDFLDFYFSDNEMRSSPFNTVFFFARNRGVSFKISGFYIKRYKLSAVLIACLTIAGFTF